MRDINDRLKKVNYQILRSKLSAFSDTELIEKAQSVYDAAIDSSTPIDVNAIFPSTACGVALDWDNDNKELVFERAAMIVYDNLADNILPEPFNQQVEPVLGVDNDYYILSSGAFLAVD